MSAPALEEAQALLQEIASTLQRNIAEWEKKTGLRLVCIELGRIDTTTHAQLKESSIVSVLCTAEIEVKGRA